MFKNILWYLLFGWHRNQIKHSFIARCGMLITMWIQSWNTLGRGRAFVAKHKHKVYVQWRQYNSTFPFKFKGCCLRTDKNPFKARNTSNPIRQCQNIRQLWTLKRTNSQGTRFTKCSCLEWSWSNFPHKTSIK